MQDTEWIEWAGGECPVEGRRRVEARLRDGATEEMDANSFDWEHLQDDAENDIVAYRVLA